MFQVYPKGCCFITMDLHSNQEVQKWPWQRRGDKKYGFIKGLSIVHNFSVQTLLPPDRDLSYSSSRHRSRSRAPYSDKIRLCFNRIGFCVVAWRHKCNHKPHNNIAGLVMKVIAINWTKKVPAMILSFLDSRISLDQIAVL